MPKRPGAPSRPALLSDRGKGRVRRFLAESLDGLAALLVRAICATQRVECVDEERFFGQEGGKILCLWHGRPFPLMTRVQGVSLTVLISLSRDGELINSILATMGFRAARGSSGPSGARALAACIKLLRAGEIVVVTPDGPRGPSGVLQAGVVTMAKKSGRPIIPTGSSSRPRITTRSWDRFTVPLPFARSVVLFGRPIYVEEGANEAEALVRVQAEMRRLQDEADRRLKTPTWAEMAAKDA